MESCLVPEGPIYLRILVRKCVASAIYNFEDSYKLLYKQTTVMSSKFFTASIGLRCFTILSIIHMNRSVHDVSELECF